MIRTILTLSPRPDANGAIIELFERDEIIETALTVEGCLSVELWDRDGELLVVATWESRDSYSQWLDHSERDVGMEELNSLLTTPVTPGTRGVCYDVVLGGDIAVAEGKSSSSP